MLRRFLVVLVLLAVPLAATPTPFNDDSCDVGVLPAATLLLPFFDVDLEDPYAETTLVTVVNVTNFEQIAQMTLWTDRGYPVLTFPIYLTGYDAQGINLYDVLARGVVAPNAATPTSRRGTFSDRSTTISTSGCTGLRPLDAATLARLRRALVDGVIEGECNDLGGLHGRAIGYATIDVVRSCDPILPTDPRYWTEHISYDNVLTGDYQQVNSHLNFAQGNALVHIRAIPEGGTFEQRRASGAVYAAAFPRTFYERYQSKEHPSADGRQPLPSRFAARWINGSSAGFRTYFKIWREGEASVAAGCTDYAREAAAGTTDIVLFDENENATSISSTGMPLSSMTSVDDPRFYPQPANGATSGWMYLNLDRAGEDGSASMSWVLVSMRADGRYSADMDAIGFGNGCSPPSPATGKTAAFGPQIAPSRDDNRGIGSASTDNDDSCDVAILPAATLLLPYFEVDTSSVQGENTLFTITNVTPQDRIARVTLWTDISYPVLTFNIFLTGYDVQSISVRDVLSGALPSNGSFVSPRGVRSETSAALDISHCGQLGATLDAATVAAMLKAFTEGRGSGLGTGPSCDDIGLVHYHAIGYATIDVVRNCSANDPTDAAYWTKDIAFDNVLIGDYQQLNANQQYAQGSAMVHVRAIPEGGTAATRVSDAKYATRFPRTFYSRYQSPLTPKLDGRQPLPSAFATRWIQGGATQMGTFVKAWREGKPGAVSLCGMSQTNVTKVSEIVRFDEEENAVGDIPVSRVCTPINIELTLPSTARVSVADASVFPQLTNGATSGWVYLNLDNCDCDAPLASSNWIMTSMRAEGRYSVDMDATALGNGCSPQSPASEVTTGTWVIGPAVNR